MDKKEKKKSKAADIFAKIRSVKHIEWIVAGIAIVVMLGIYLTSFLPSRGASASGNGPPPGIGTGAEGIDHRRYMEQRLAAVLSQIEGVGRTEIMINWESSVEIIIAYITNESGGASSSAPALVTVPGGGTRPIILKEIKPRALGVVIVAQGGADTRTRLNIIAAVTVLLNMSADNVSVFAMRA